MNVVTPILATIGSAVEARSRFKDPERRVALTARGWVALWLLVLLLISGSVGCQANQSATSLTSTAIPRLTLIPAPEGTGNYPLGYEWGYVDTDGDWIIEPRFEKARVFAEGLAAVQLGGKWGYIDQTGAIVIQPQFTEAHPFRGGTARVATGPERLPGLGVTASAYGFVDKTGRMVIPAKWDEAGDFDEGLAAVMSGSKCGFIDTSGKVVIPLEFDMLGPFSEGLAQACVGGKYGYIDEKGEWGIKPQFKGLASAGLLDSRITYALGGRFKDGLAPVYSEGDYLDGGTCQYIDETGTKAFPQVFQRGGEFSEGLAPVCVNDKWGFIDTSGRMVIEPQYEALYGPEFYLLPDRGFHDGLAPVALDHKVGYVDKTGTFAVTPQYAYGSGFYGGFALVCTETYGLPNALLSSTGRLIYRAGPITDSSSTTSP